MPVYRKRVKSREDDRTTGRGYIAETVDFGLVAGTGTPLTGNIYVYPVYLYAGEIITNISYACIGAGTSVSRFELGLYDSTRTRVATTGDVKAALSANTFLTSALSAAYTVPSDGIYYVAILETHTNTAPTFQRGQVFAVSNYGAFAASPGGYITTQTDLAAGPLTFLATYGSVNVPLIWMGLS